MRQKAKNQDSNADHLSQETHLTGFHRNNPRVTNVQDRELNPLERHASDGTEISYSSSYSDFEGSPHRIQFDSRAVKYDNFHDLQSNRDYQASTNYKHNIQDSPHSKLVQTSQDKVPRDPIPLHRLLHEDILDMTRRLVHISFVRRFNLFF